MATLKGYDFYFSTASGGMASADEAGDNISNGGGEVIWLRNLPERKATAVRKYALDWARSNPTKVSIMEGGWAFFFAPMTQQILDILYPLGWKSMHDAIAEVKV
jgi:hypothetical protein